MFTYDPPAGVNDFTGPYASSQGAFASNWHGYIKSQFDTNIQTLKSALMATPLFFSEVYTAVPAGQAVAPVSWNGFPRRLALQYADRDQLMAAADTLQDLGNGTMYRPQDEYLEWRAVTSGQAVTKFVFTAEAREYWSHVSQIDTKLIEDLYQKLCDDTTIRYEQLRVQRSFKIGGKCTSAVTTTPGTITTPNQAAFI